MAQTKTFLYAFLKPWVRLGASFFFRRLEVRNAHLLPHDKPVLLVANHQNAMLDPVILCLYSTRQLHWLTRADVFRNPIVSKLLHMFNMMPVYRERDRVSDIGERNEAAFKECYTRLAAGAVICIFPEGTHRGKKQLVPLKKGMSRMITGAVQHDVKDLVVVPVGLDYENYYEYRKNLLINFGEPIAAADLLKDCSAVNGKTAASVTEKVRAALSSLMIDIRNDDVYQEIMSLKPLCDKISQGRSLAERFEFFKKISMVLDENVEHHHFLNHVVNRYRKVMHELGVQEDLYVEKLPVLALLSVLFGLVFAITAAIVYAPVYILTERFVSVKVKDPLFRNSIRMTFWTFLIPPYLLMTTLFIGIWKCDTAVALIFLLMTMISGVIALKWWRQWRILHLYQKRERLKGERKDKFDEWLRLRSTIVNHIINLQNNKKHV